MLTLALETSVVPGSIALSDGGKCIAERPLQPDRRHAETLVPEILQMFADHGFAADDCGLVAVSVGPGSFTGLRVGVTCAKTWAYATGAAAVAVPTFLAIAHNAADDVDELFVIGDAQRKQLFCGTCHRDGGGCWQMPGEIAIVDAASWAAQRADGDVVTGPALVKYHELFDGRCRLLSPEQWSPRAAVIGDLGERMVAAGEAADIWSLQPLYLRKSAAEERAESR